MKKKMINLLMFSSILLTMCTSSQQKNTNESEDNNIPREDELTRESFANVLDVKVKGSPSAYTFDVSIKSPDMGCDQYADWWEVLDENGNLLYRRILAHSHVSEQPFTRSGGPVNIQEETIVIIRAHFNPTGYGGFAYRGSVRSGFKSIELPSNFSKRLENEPPLPTGCAF